ncbi:unnamed protein product [Ectocarpus sp. CCAP 1310/34]|nr:unnamed protein product [Ectocarpus sp. CCAP 1310/34]
MIAAAAAATTTAATIVNPAAGRPHVHALAAAAAVAILEVSPHKAPAAAALAVKEEGGSDAVASAVAAGVAAAAVGWRIDKIEEISRDAAIAFVNGINRGITVQQVAADVASAVNRVSSRYPAVEAAAAAAHARCLTHRRVIGPVGVNAPAAAAAAAADEIAAANAAAAAAAAAAFVCSRQGDLPYDDASYAAKAAAGAAINRGAAKKDAVAAAARALVLENEEREARRPPGVKIASGVVHVAIADAAGSASAVPGSAPVPVPIGTFGAEGYFEVMPSCHELTLAKMQTIREVDIFMAGFLLFSLTGRQAVDTGLTDEEELQIVFQTCAFGVFLAATILTGMCTLCTGCRYALTSKDLIVPFGLSVLGFVLLLISVAEAVHIELGDGFYHDDHDHDKYWVTVGLGLGSSVLAVFYAVFIYLYGHKFKWEFFGKFCGDGWVLWVKKYRIVHTGGASPGATTTGASSTTGPSKCGATASIACSSGRRRTFRVESITATSSSAALTAGRYLRLPTNLAASGRSGRGKDSRVVLSRAKRAKSVNWKAKGREEFGESHEGCATSCYGCSASCAYFLAYG